MSILNYDNHFIAIYLPCGLSIIKEIKAFTDFKNRELKFLPEIKIRSHGLGRRIFTQICKLGYQALPIQSFQRRICEQVL